MYIQETGLGSVPRHPARSALDKGYIKYRARLAQHRRMTEGLNGMDGWFSNVWNAVKPSAVIKKTIQVIPKPAAVLQVLKKPTISNVTGLLKQTNPLMMPVNILKAQELLPHQIMPKVLPMPGPKQPTQAEIDAQQRAAQAAYDAQYAKDQAAAQAAYDAQYAREQAAAQAEYDRQMAQQRMTESAQPYQSYQPYQPAPLPDYQRFQPTAASSADYSFSPTDTTGYIAPESDVVIDSGVSQELPVPETNPAMTVVSTPGSVSYVDDFTDNYQYGSGTINYNPDTGNYDEYGDNTMQGFGAVTPAVPASAAGGFDWGGFANALVGTWQQKKLVDLNIERMKQGQPPLNIAESGVGAQVNVNLDPTVKKALMFGGLALAGVGVILLLRGRRGR